MPTYNKSLIFYLTPAIIKECNDKSQNGGEDEMNFSKKALWLACSSEYGERLAQITREHVSLAKELSLNGRFMTARDREIIAARVESLRQERDGIISLFEKNTHSEESY
ncbi:hypothetical protein [Thermicanus aegyptius]|uniref:hypothetical protein n=1 Tax=Thermicanus aegyptius TaxID=94009 RepID=UPI000402192E|nr:hypothetical protein [Thermicanus aegyptius]